MEKRFDPVAFQVLFHRYHNDKACKLFYWDWYNKSEFEAYREEYQQLRQLAKKDNITPKYRVFEYEMKQGKYAIKYFSASDKPLKNVASTVSRSINQRFPDKTFKCSYDFKLTRVSEWKYYTYEEAQFMMNLYVDKLMRVPNVIVLNRGASIYKDKLRNPGLSWVNKYHNPDKIRVAAVNDYPAIYLSIPPLNMENIFQIYQVVIDLVNEFGENQVAILDENSVPILPDDKPYLFALFLDDDFIHESQLKHAAELKNAEKSIKARCIMGINAYELWEECLVSAAS